MKKAFYAKLPTEQNNPRSKNIDTFSIEQILSLMNKEDATVPKAVARVKPQIAKGVQLMTACLKNNGRIFFAGAGTSGRLGVLEAAECPPTFNTSPSLIQAVMAGGKNAVFRSREGAEDNEEEALRIFRKKLRPNDIVIGIAASGVTPFVAGALTAAKEINAKTILVTCNSKLPPPFPSPSKRGRAGGGIDCLIAPKVGPEVITGSTRLKAGTATKLILNMLTVAAMVQMGKVYKNWMVDLQPKSRKLVFRGLNLIEKLGRVSPAEAQRLFQISKRQVKTAILMAKRKCEYSAAALKLKKSNGFLSRALSS